jgi:hypothetical protein
MAFPIQSGRAADCTDYPLPAGSLEIQPVEGGERILATASAPVSFDDAGALNDAREEAQMEARAALARFLNDTIQRDTSLNQAVRENRSMQGEGMTATRNEVIERLRQLRSSTGALLRGVAPLGECYTRGREVRVTVGIKPETIAAARRLSGNMAAGAPASRPPGTEAPAGASGGREQPGSSGAMPLRDMGSYSNTGPLQRF